MLQLTERDNIYKNKTANRIWLVIEIIIVCFYSSPSKVILPILIIGNFIFIILQGNFYKDKTLNIIWTIIQMFIISSYYFKSKYLFGILAMCNIIFMFLFIYLKGKEPFLRYVYGPQFQIKEDIAKIVNNSNSQDPKKVVKKIEDYYKDEFHNHNIDIYLSRIYYLEKEYSGMDNIKYGVSGGLTVYLVTYIVQDIFESPELHEWNIIAKFIYLIISFMAAVVIVLILHFGYFTPNKERSLGRLLNEEEIRIVRELIAKYMTTTHL